MYKEETSRGENEVRETVLDLGVCKALALILGPEWNVCHEVDYLLSYHPSTPVYTDPATR